MNEPLLQNIILAVFSSAVFLNVLFGIKCLYKTIKRQEVSLFWVSLLTYATAMNFLMLLQLCYTLAVKPNL